MTRKELHETLPTFAQELEKKIDSVLAGKQIASHIVVDVFAILVARLEKAFKIRADKIAEAGMTIEGELLKMEKALTESDIKSEIVHRMQENAIVDYALKTLI